MLEKTEIIPRFEKIDDENRWNVNNMEKIKGTILNKVEFEYFIL